MKPRKPVTILIAEDDPDDRMLCKEALEEVGLADGIVFVEDGEELIEYLQHKGRYSEDNDLPRPELILLDLNMPRKDGRDALLEIKEDPELKLIPVIVLTTSKADEDIFNTYSLGVSGYITKPTHFDDLVIVMRTIGKYWFEVVELPSEPG